MTSSHSAFRVFSVACLVLLVSGCQLEKLKKGTVGKGIARLTVRNAAALLSYANDDTACGFGSMGVLSTPTIIGNPGEEGSVTWRVTNCTVNFPTATVVGEDCTGGRSSLEGRAVLNATRTISGTITGNPENPVIPGTSKAVLFDVSAELDGFRVRESESTDDLRNISGTLSFKAQPPLAVSASQGVCAVATNEVFFSEIRYDAAKVHVTTKDRDFDADVEASDFEAQAGRGEESENSYQGTLTVWGKKVELPGDDEDEAGLDPDYDAEKFVASYACKADLAQPITHACPQVKDLISTGAAQLTVKTFGRMMSYFAKEETCGLSSMSAKTKAKLSGALGKQGGEATVFADNCNFTWNQPTVLKEDCVGAQTIAEGTLTMSGTQTTKGYRTGSVETPIIPTGMHNAHFTAAMDFNNFTLGDTGGTSITFKSGRLTGQVAPRLAINKGTGVCSIQTSHAEFTNLKLENADIIVKHGGNTFTMRINQANLDAQNGTKGDKTNWLAGAMIIDGKPMQLPLPNVPPVLDPDYNAATFDDADMCKGDMRFATSDAECSFKRPLAENTARLLVKTLGAATSMAASDSSCGYKNWETLATPDDFNWNPGRGGWDVDNCTLGNGRDQLRERSACTGDNEYITGSATYSGRQTVWGNWALSMDVIKRLKPESVRFDYRSLSFNRFATWSTPANGGEPRAIMTISGDATGEIWPIMGENASDLGVFDVTTPVALIKAANFANIRGSLEANGMTFAIDVPRANLTAQNGSYAGRSNWLNGTIVFDGEEFLLENVPLDPDFNQAAFDASYACTPGLRAPIAP